AATDEDGRRRPRQLSTLRGGSGDQWSSAWYIVDRRSLAASFSRFIRDSVVSSIGSTPSSASSTFLSSSLWWWYRRLNSGFLLNSASSSVWGCPSNMETSFSLARACVPCGHAKTPRAWRHGACRVERQWQVTD